MSLLFSFFAILIVACTLVDQKHKVSRQAKAAVEKEIEEKMGEMHDFRLLIKDSGKRSDVKV